MEAPEATIAAPFPGFPADDQGFLWLWDRHGRAQRVEILMPLEYGDCLFDDKKSGLSHPHPTASIACPACAALRTSPSPQPSRGGDSRVTADGDDGDGQGSRFWRIQGGALLTEAAQRENFGLLEVLEAIFYRRLMPAAVTRPPSNKISDFACVTHSPLERAVPMVPTMAMPHTTRVTVN